MVFNLNDILKTLSKKRPIFYSERDFQEELYKEISLKTEFCEMNKWVEGEKVDLWFEINGEEFIIELRYKTKKLQVNVNNEIIHVKTHGSQEISRYDFLKDVMRLEQICFKKANRNGFAIFLTNDNQYWELINRIDTIDREFLLYEGRYLSGTYTWNIKATKAITFGREEPIEIMDKYELRWLPFSYFRSKKSVFKYLCVRINTSVQNDKSNTAFAFFKKNKF